MAAAQDGQPQEGGRRDLRALRPGAIVTNKPQLPTSTLEPVTAGGSRACPSPGVRVSVANKAGKNREIAKIEPPGKIGDFYDFGSILGQGGFGTVSEILHAKTFQPFAGKVVEKWKSERLLLEYDVPFRQVMENLLNNEHPHVVRMLHVFEDEDNYYQVMEACQGGTLRRFIRSFERSQIPVPVVEDILDQVTRALDFLHSLKIIHRDIKPDNVVLAGRVEAADIVAKTKKVKLNIVDFDMCRFLDDDDEVKSGHVEGTPGYLAPEILETKRYSVRTDMFGFGCLMYFVMLHEEPCPEMDFDGAPTCDLAEVLARWTSEALQICAAAALTVEVAEAASQESPGVSSSEKPGDSSPKSPASQVEPVCPPEKVDGIGDPLYEGLPVRLWKLLAWCLDIKPQQRPASARAVLLSGYINGEAASPRSPISPGLTSREPNTTRRERREKREKKNRASIDDLLRLSNAPGR